ncbi:MAG: hypothetical protein MJY55_04050 [Bacteroidales bacterium]|nr:hypothetical protein [Bacteroidales bacterium]
MKRNLFALISVVLSLSEFSVSALSAATDYKEHKFQDGIYTARADKKAEKSAVSASKENAAALVAATKSSNIYEQEAGAGIRMTCNMDDILNSLEVGSQVFVLNINNPWSRNCWGCGYWGYYDPFYWDRWYDPFWRPWDPFWYDRWRWGWGPYYVGPWGPWGPWPYGPDPWWPGYRPAPVYPVHPWRPAGTYATAMRGGNHNMSGSGLNRRIATPAGGGSGAVVLGTGSRVAAASRTAQPGRTVSRTPGRKITPVGTSVQGSKVVTPARRQTATATAVTPSRRQAATATTVTPSRRQATTAATVTPARRQAATATTVAPTRRQTSVATGNGQTPNVKINRNVRSSQAASSASRSSQSVSGISSSSYRKSASSSGSSNYGGSSRSYSGGSHSYGGGGGMSRSASSGGGMSRSVSGGGHGRR